LLEYVQGKINSSPKLLRVCYDRELSNLESQLYSTYISKISVHTLYICEKDNKKDRGEVLTLAYMAVKEFPYFASNDAQVRRLIEQAEELNTGLDYFGFLSFYEILYFLNRKKCYSAKGLKKIYKYLYYLTKTERSTNPNWNEFVDRMRSLYD